MMIMSLEISILKIFLLNLLQNLIKKKILLDQDEKNTIGNKFSMSLTFFEFFAQMFNFKCLSFNKNLWFRRE